MVYERRSPKGQNQAGRGRASEEARWRVRRAQKVGGETCCRQQGRRGCRWHVLASRRRMRGWWLIIESVAAGQNRLVNVGHVITVVRILTVGQGEQVEKQWKCVDPCKSHHYASWKNPGNGSFVGVKVSWQENEVVVRIAILLGGTDMAPFVSKNRREKRCQRIERWMFCSAPIIPKPNGVTRTYHTGTDCIILSPWLVTTSLNAVGRRPHPPSIG